MMCWVQVYHLQALQVSFSAQATDPSIHGSQQTTQQLSLNSFFKRKFRNDIQLLDKRLVQLKPPETGQIFIPAISFHLLSLFSRGFHCIQYLPVPFRDQDFLLNAFK